MLLSSVADTLRIWSFSAQPSAGESPLTLRVSSEPYLPREKPSTLSWNHTNQVIAVAGAESPSISLVQVSNGQLLSSLPFSEAEACTGGIHAIAFSGNSRYLAAGSARSVYLYDLKRRNLRATSPEQRGDVSCVAIAPEGEVVIGDQAGVVCVWDLRQSSSQTTTDLFLPPPSSSSSATDSFGSGSSVFAVGPAVTSLRLSLIGPPRIATGYADGTLAVWDFTTKALLRRQAVHTGPLAGLAYSPKNSRLVATAGADGRLALVDTGSKGSTDPSAAVDVGERLSCVSFNEDAIHCAVGTHSGHILIYDWRNVRKPLCRVEASPHVPVADLSFQVRISCILCFPLMRVLPLLFNIDRKYPSSVSPTAPIPLVTWTASAIQTLPAAESKKQCSIDTQSQRPERPGERRQQFTGVECRSRRSGGLQHVPPKADENSPAVAEPS